LEKTDGKLTPNKLKRVLASGWGKNYGRLYLLFIVVVASAADWLVLRLCECVRERGKQKACKPQV